jgi:hypothetical protein
LGARTTPYGVGIKPTVRAGDRVVVLHWYPLAAPSRSGFHVDRAVGRQTPFSRVTGDPLAFPSFADTAVTNGSEYRYRFVAVSGAHAGAVSPEVRVRPRGFRSDRAFLEFLQATAFDFFWFRGNPTNGLVPDRSSADSVCSIAALGFGLTGWTIGVDHGWIGRSAARQRTRAALQTLECGRQGPEPEGVMGHRGWFYHFLDMSTGHRVWRCELSSVDTAWLFAGLLHAREFYDRAHPEERELRERVDALMRRTDFAWMTAGEETLRMGWRPESGFLPDRWQGYNEAMWLLLMALGATEVPSALSWSAWTETYLWGSHYGFDFVEFPPLFGHQYSHCWVDFRRQTDRYLGVRGLTYFENSRRATLAQRAYCVENPLGHEGYSQDCWGLTACDGPGRAPFAGYSARGAPPPFLDDGTVAPTAAGSSIAFAPRESLAALRHFHDRYRQQIWTPYGFRDAFNLTAAWWGPDVLGIDQGPMLLMIENALTGKVWQRFGKSAWVQRGLEQAGFRAWPQP